MRASVLLVLVVPIGCNRSTSSGSSDASVAASSPAAAATSAAPATDTAPSAEKWCAHVFATNRKCGFMVGNQYKIKPTDEEFKCDAREVLAKRDGYAAITPLEIRPDVEKQSAWLDATMKWADAHGGNIHAPGIPPPPPGLVQSEERLFKYQVDHCGLNPQRLR